MHPPNLYSFTIKGNHYPDFSHRSFGGFLSSYLNHIWISSIMGSDAEVKNFLSCSSRGGGCWGEHIP